MGSRAVKQPNGLYARFSEIVDDFTHANCSREELWAFYRDECGVECANGKMQRADENANRFDEAIDIIKCIHGKELAEERRKEFSEPPQDTMEVKNTSTNQEKHKICSRCGAENSLLKVAHDKLLCSVCGQLE